MRHLDAENSELEDSRARVDACAAVDAAMQRRQIAGEVVVIPSITATPDGDPRFVLGFTLDELAHPAIAAFAEAETQGGALAEYRNFLDESVRAGDVVIDLDPGAGAGVFTAATATARVQVRVYTTDAMLGRALRRNDEAHRGASAPSGPNGARATPGDSITIESTPISSRSLNTVVGASGKGRVFIHAGAHPLTELVNTLGTAANRPIAVAFATADSANHAAMSRRGMQSFVLTMGADGMLELTPYSPAAMTDATYAFALSRSFISTCE